MEMLDGDTFYLGIAIEDRVDLAVRRRRTSGKSVEIEDIFQRSSAIEGVDYFVSVRSGIRNLFRELYLFARQGQEPHQLFQRIRRLVVSSVGVVEDNARLIQLPLWNWPTFRKIHWYFGDEYREGFDFKLIIIEALLETAYEFADHELVLFVGKHARKYADRIHVVNDLASCAAAYHAFRETQGDHRSLLYVKADNGVNVGAHGEGFEKSPSNTEFGHLYVRRHPTDLATGFPGFCPYHGDCVEGMIGFHAMLARQEQGGFSDAARFTSSVTHPPVHTPAGRSIKAELVPTGEAVELIAHYLGHLIHAALLSPLSVQSVVLGGKMINAEVTHRVQGMVADLASEYPLRKNLQKEKIRSLIEESEYPDKSRIEIEGALGIAARPPMRVYESEKH